jgi:hypothetical protein
MEASRRDERDRVPWYAWPLVPLVLPVVVLVMIPLGVLALISIPYYAVFPDHHAHFYDFQGTPHQKETLARWRAAYRRLSFPQRIGRAFKLHCRRCRRCGRRS